MMKIAKTSISGLYVIDTDPIKDERGYFARTFCTKELEENNIKFSIDQISTSYNQRAGTLRGMHYQQIPHPEVKIVRCSRGTIFDVVLDLRKSSQTYLKWLSFELSHRNSRSLLIPEGCAHGFQTLEDESEVLYTNQGVHNAEYSRTVRWNDPAFKIDWPKCSNRIMSEKDRLQPDFLE